MSTYWKSSPFSWRAWGDEFVVFNRLSGSTHLLTAKAAKVLFLLEQRPGSALDLSNQLAADAGIETDSELLGHVESLLAELDELGLVEPVS